MIDKKKQDPHKKLDKETRSILSEIAEKCKGKDLFPERTKEAKEFMKKVKIAPSSKF